MLKKHPLFLLILPVATALRIGKLGGKQLWVDEIIQALDSSHSTIKEILLAARSEIAAAPLDLLIQHYAIILLGRSEFSLRLHAAIFGILTVATLYYITRVLLGNPVATIASLLYALYPLHHH